MFEGLVTSMLNKYLGDFIENFRPEDINIGIMGGDVNLSNLTVKGSGLDFLRLPIKVKSGFIGSLQIKANWRSLSSQPVEVILSDVFVVAEPRTSFHVDEKKDLESALSSKLFQLKAGEDMLLDVEATKESDNDDSYVARTAAAVVDNIQLTLNNLHIRFEDALDTTPLSFGVCIEELSARTTDMNWDYKFITGQSIVYKLCALKNFFMYLNVGNKQAEPLNNVHDLRRVFVNTRGQGLQFLLAPVNASLKVRANKNELPGPRVTVSFDCASIDFKLRETQYNGLLGVASQLGKIG